MITGNSVLLESVKRKNGTTKLPVLSPNQAVALLQHKTDNDRHDEYDKFDAPKTQISFLLQFYGPH